jgi:hypothetical protein
LTALLASYILKKIDRMEGTPQFDAARISEDFHAAEWTSSPHREVRRPRDPFRSNYLRLQPVGVAGLVGCDEPQLHAALLLPAFGTSDVGPQPFAFGPVLPERYRVWRVKRSVSVQRSS